MDTSKYISILVLTTWQRKNSHRYWWVGSFRKHLRCAVNKTLPFPQCHFWFSGHCPEPNLKSFWIWCLSHRRQGLTLTPSQSNVGTLHIFLHGFSLISLRYLTGILLKSTGTLTVPHSLEPPNLFHVDLSVLLNSKCICLLTEIKILTWEVKNFQECMLPRVQCW